MKTSKISLVILAFFSLAAFLNAHEPRITTLMNSAVQTHTVESESPINQASVGVVDPGQLFSLALVSVAIMAGIFFIVNFHLQRRKKIIAVQKKNYNMETPFKRSQTGLNESDRLQETKDYPRLHSHLKVS